jgi:valyl-tRNA synthetase
MRHLADRAIDAVDEGRTTFVPENWTKIYYDWMKNIRDWCISRQLWWGHRIPAWHCSDCNGITVAIDDPTVCEHCGSKNLEQDADVLDTWFSSGLWPFSTMGWPDKTADLEKFYPTTLLNTGFDILFFWVARMMVLGLECMDEVPFRKVYIHGLVRDAERQKMSKTKGNTVDPLDIIDQYGTDACRITLLLGAAPGTDIVLSDERLKASRAFANKIWNAARFIFLNMERSGVEPWIPENREDYAPVPDPATGEVPLEDRWLFSRISHYAGELNKSIENYRYHEAAQGLWHFFWGDFCDWYLELKKLRFEENSGRNHHWQNMVTAFEASLRLLHPVMPFITEELWQRLREEGSSAPESIALAAFPQASEKSKDEAAEKEVALLQDIIGSIRNLRADLKMDPKAKVDAEIYARGKALEVATSQAEPIRRLANVNFELKESSGEKLSGAVKSTPDFDLLLKVSAAELETQRNRVQKDIKQLEKVIANSQRQLSNEQIVAKMPPHVVDNLRTKLAEYQEKHEKSVAALEALSR